jgi:hypothetical protein
MPAWTGVADPFCAPAGAGLVPDPVQMRSDRADRQGQPLGDLSVGRPSGRHRHDLPLSFRQRAGGTIGRCLTSGGNGGRSPRIGLGGAGGQGDGVGWLSVRPWRQAASGAASPSVTRR